jgi:predicted nucleotidyltransferase
MRFERRPPPERAAVVAALRDFFAGLPEVRLAYLFGSLARGAAGPLSDVDVAVLADREAVEADAGFGGYATRLTTRLMERLAFSKVDLALLHAAPSLLRFLVVRDGVLLREREPGEALRFKLDAIRDYIDFEPVRRIPRRYLRESLGMSQEGDRRR